GQRLKSVIVHWQTGCKSRWFFFLFSFFYLFFKRATACSGSGQRLKSVIVHWQTGCESRWFFFAIHLPFSFSSGRPLAVGRVSG
ncbi:MAG: hypothetical protein IJD21_00180, partial [Oscillospiraceae bacterium]|nr:hypothetical protein [Oscillospiraceae bacterium]